MRIQVQQKLQKEKGQAHEPLQSVGNVYICLYLIKAFCVARVLRREESKNLPAALFPPQTVFPDEYDPHYLSAITEPKAS